MRVACITGHRPKDMPGYGYDYSNEKWCRLKNRIKNILVDMQITDLWDGMAIGVDMIATIAVLELKDEGYDIKLHCAIPCQDHCSKWPKKDRVLYNEILHKADEVILVSDEPYKPYLMQKRNMYMVDRSICVLAVWNGKRSGGTYNCIAYAQEQVKQIVRIEP